MSVCVCLSVCKNISETTRAILTNFVHGVYGRGSILLRRLCDTLCTSGFVDDIMFFYNLPYSGMNFATKDRFPISLKFTLFIAKSYIIQLFVSYY